jgi:hypothetical protein
MATACGVYIQHVEKCQHGRQAVPRVTAFGIAENGIDVQLVLPFEWVFLESKSIRTVLSTRSTRKGKRAGNFNPKEHFIQSLGAGWDNDRLVKVLLG